MESDSLTAARGGVQHCGAAVAAEEAAVAAGEATATQFLPTPPVGC